MRFSVSINNQQAHPIINLTDKVTGCQAEIYAFGGLLNAFKIPIKDKIHNCIEGFNSVADARKNISNSFRSAKLSPFVCRMRNGSYTFSNKKYIIHKHYLGEHAIHGLIYDAHYLIEDQQATDTEALVKLKFIYNKLDQGYPFSYEIVLVWKLSIGNKLSVTSLVKHNNSIVIPYADGWHPYFTLGSKIDNCTLAFPSNTQLEFDKALLPTGKKIKDNRFINGASLRGIFLDNSYELNPMKANQCILKNSKLQLMVEPDESYPILQVYTPISRKSIAIENLTGAPDNFNNQIGLIFLEPKKQYSFTTSYTISTI